jgi:8-oxo-dGTP diphosphatase
MTVYAAGALLWREVDGKLSVALIHRARYDDWSWPKGKQDPGETLPETAVREIAEETGLKIRLGVPLHVARYTVGKGEPKEVHYWAARVSDKALAASTFEPSEEVASVEWRSPAEARKLLTYVFDQQVLDQLVDLRAKNLLQTKPVIVLRHAKATPRSEWKGGRGVDDGHRPLLAEGLAQAEKLKPLLAAFGIKRLITSPWVRCRSTIEPFAKERKLKLIERHQLSEFGNAKGPKRTANVVGDVIEDGRASVICSHRPALPTVLAKMAQYADSAYAANIEAAASLKPAQMLVVHLSKAKIDGKRTVVGVETHSPFGE